MYTSLKALFSRPRNHKFKDNQYKVVFSITKICDSIYMQKCHQYVCYNWNSPRSAACDEEGWIRRSSAGICVTLPRMCFASSPCPLVIPAFENLILGTCRHTARFHEQCSVSHPLNVVNYEGAFLVPRCVAITVVIRGLKIQIFRGVP
jgi:hypothetical protein